MYVSSLEKTTGGVHAASCCQPVAIILSDNEPAQLGKLTAQRSKAALPFAGEYRLIDFALSNCVHSGIDVVGVITQYQPRSLHTHLAYGRPWDLDRPQGGLTLLHPYQGHSGIRWYGGTADAIYQNLDFIHHCNTPEVLILAGDQVFKQDLNVLVARHREAQANLTIATVAVEPEQAEGYYTLLTDSSGWVRELIPPESSHPGSLAVIGMMLFSTEVLDWRLNEDAVKPDSGHHLLHDLISHMIQAGDRVLAFQYTHYWNGIQTVPDYWQAGMSLLSENPSLNLQDAGWPIQTQIQSRPPTRIEMGARISHSLVSGGCVIEGTVEYAILSPGVYVGPGAVVRHSIVMHHTMIEECAYVENAIVDMDVTIGQQAQVGIAQRNAPTLNVLTAPPIAVVEKGAIVPTNAAVEPEPFCSDLLLPTRQQAQASTDRH